MYQTRQIDRPFDIIVVGGGPAGSMAAWQAARLGASVLLLEKDREVGIPVRCAEAVGKRSLEELIEKPAPAHWIAAEISRFRLVAPDGTKVFVDANNETGYVLHRRIFDSDLAAIAANAGAQLLTSAEVTGVLKSDGVVRGVRTSLGNESVEISSRIVIAADGVESRVARWAGIDSTVRLKDMETCAQYTLANIDCDPSVCDFYFSREFAPGGYAWVFPKGERVANVGLGISGNFSRKGPPEERLELYLERFFPAASIVSRTVGGVPVDKTLKSIVADGFMVIGDAAHQANPISGGGIISGMIAGKISGEVAAEAIRTGNVGQKALLPYARQWHKRVGKSHARTYRLKEALMKFDDRQLNSIAEEYLKLKDDQRNILNLFKTAFRNKPSFLFDVIKIFSSF